MDVSIKFDTCTYCVFTLYSRIIIVLRLILLEFVKELLLSIKNILHIYNHNQSEKKLNLHKTIQHC